jgi:hypothetical protein
MARRLGVNRTDQPEGTFTRALPDEVHEDAFTVHADGIYAHGVRSLTITGNYGRFVTNDVLTHVGRTLQDHIDRYRAAMHLTLDPLRILQAMRESPEVLEQFKALVLEAQGGFTPEHLPEFVGILDAAQIPAPTDSEVEPVAAGYRKQRRARITPVQLQRAADIYRLAYAEGLPCVQCVQYVYDVTDAAQAIERYRRGVRPTLSRDQAAKVKRKAVDAGYLPEPPGPGRRSPVDDTEEGTR